MASETEWSKAFWSTCGIISGVVFTPFTAVGMLTCQVVEDIKYGSEKTTNTFVEIVKAEDKLSTTTMLGITEATMPLSLLFSPISVPLIAIGTPILAAFVNNTDGDVTPVSEDED